MADERVGDRESIRQFGLALDEAQNEGVAASETYSGQTGHKNCCVPSFKQKLQTLTRESAASNRRLQTVWLTLSDDGDSQRLSERARSSAGPPHQYITKTIFRCTLCTPKPLLIRRSGGLLARSS